MDFSSLLSKNEYDILLVDCTKNSPVEAIMKTVLNSYQSFPFSVIFLVDRDQTFFNRIKLESKWQIVYKPFKSERLIAAVTDIVFSDLYHQPGMTILPAMDKKRILLVEDILVNQILVKTMLKDTGIIIDVADDGKKALNMIEKNNYNLIFMDLQMPTMDGITATKIIRQKLKLKDLPIIAMTAQTMEDDRQICLQAGMNDYISKPIRNEDLHGLLHKWLFEEEKRKK